MPVRGGSARKNPLRSRGSEIECILWLLTSVLPEVDVLYSVPFGCTSFFEGSVVRPMGASLTLLPVAF